MSSSYTTRLALEKQADGENPNSWGTVLNQNVIDLLDTAIAGYQIVSVSSIGVSLTSNNGAADTARTFGIRFEGLLTANVTVTIPQKEKIYAAFNGTTGSFAITMKTAGGTAVTVPTSGKGTILACDGISINNCSQPLDASISVTSLIANSITATSVSASSITASVGVFSTVSISTPLTVPNGGMGAATFTDAGVLIGNATGAIQVTTAGTVGQLLTSNGAGVDPTFQTATTTSAATQAQMEAASSNTVMVTPLSEKWAPSSAKAWAVITAAGALTTGHNISSITDNGAGNRTVNFTTPFSSVDYVGVGIAQGANGEARILQGNTNSIPTTSAFPILCSYYTGALTDNVNYVVFFGDQ